MNFITAAFNINTVFFTVFDYQMSYLEFFGTIFNIWCVWLTTRAKILSWPVGLLGSILYLFLFYQIQLYSDVFEQLYFIITGAVGWFMWVHLKKDINQADKTVVVGVNSIKKNIQFIAILIFGTALLTYLAVNLTRWLPEYFPEPASFPILDAFTTVMSFVAQWLLIRKKVESWVLWILVDIIGIWLYWYKGVKFISLEYVLFLIMATAGLFNWLKLYKLRTKTI
jgi:nicotinamide mononucleotide transporter